MNDQKYDWIVAGAGIAGISIAEILCREGKSVLLIEKNTQIASETSKVFHEWLHTGALYSLVPDSLYTTRYLLGAMDDLFEYYGGFERMNLSQTENGISMADTGWFNQDYIEYRYKVRKFNPIWMSLVSRAVNISNLINDHDWLRRRAGGSEYGSSKIKLKYSFDLIHKQLLSNKKFYSISSPDFTMNSRVLMSDLLGSALKNGLEVVTSEAVESIEQASSVVNVVTSGGKYQADNIVICSPDIISKQFNIPVTTGYAPMAVVENVPEDEKSFVELDYYTKTCINLLKKDNGIGLAGGITVNKEKEIKPYLDYVIKEHKKRNPGIKVIDDYVGLKRELVQNKEKRNYLYHINQHDSKIWSVVLGKFTLAFSMAPEFYRRAYNINPTQACNKDIENIDTNIISKTSWKEIVDNKKKEIQ
tara:strand:+ start:14798 stop:16051 length:1254 start_codon:yes stop_codon:yes gene_type:complete